MKLFSRILLVLFFRRDLSDGFCVSGIKQPLMGAAVSVSVWSNQSLSEGIYLLIYSSSKKDDLKTFKVPFEKVQIY